MKYLVLIDNGVDYCGELPGFFDSEEQAIEAGEDWVIEFNADNSISDDEIADGLGGSFDVIPVTDTVQFQAMPHEDDCTCSVTWPVISDVCQEGMDGRDEELRDMARRER